MATVPTATARLLTTFSYGTAARMVDGSPEMRNHSKTTMTTLYDNDGDLMAAYGRYVEEQRRTLANHRILKEEQGTAAFGVSARSADGKTMLAAATRVVTWDQGWTDHEATEWVGGEPRWVITEGTYAD